MDVNWTIASIAVNRI